jgi:hypothetical protein
MLPYFELILNKYYMYYKTELSGSINAGNFLTSCKVYWLASQEGLCSMEQASKQASKKERK